MPELFRLLFVLNYSSNVYMAYVGAIPMIVSTIPLALVKKHQLIAKIVIAGAALMCFVGMFNVFMTPSFIKSLVLFTASGLLAYSAPYVYGMREISDSVREPIACLLLFSGSMTLAIFAGNVARTPGEDYSFWANFGTISFAISAVMLAMFICLVVHNVWRSLDDTPRYTDDNIHLMPGI